MDEKVRRVHIWVPAKLLEDYDKAMKGLYTTRSEAIRAGMIKMIEEKRKYYPDKSRLLL